MTDVHQGPAAAGPVPWRRRVRESRVFRWSAPVVAVVLLALATESVARQSVGGTVEWVLARPVPAAAGAVLHGLVFAILALALGRPALAGLLVLLGGVFLGTVHAAKLRSLNEPLYVSDFTLARETMAILGKGYTPFDGTYFLVLAALLPPSLLALWILPRPRMRRGARLVLAGCFAAVLAGLVLHRSTPLRGTVESVLVNMPWEQRFNYLANGLAASLALNFAPSVVLPPPGYTEQNVRAAVERILQSPPPPRVRPPRDAPPHPDLIVVLNESFWDATMLPGIRFSRDPIPTFRALAQSGAVFEVVSPSFGGQTCNAEFELLTGMNMAFLPPGSFPFVHHVVRPLPSLASYLRDLGYRTEVIHPFHRWFWNRHRVLPLLGFDTFVAMEDRATWERRGPYVGDVSLVREVIRSLDAGDGRPAFLFVISMQNHGAYAPDRYPPDMHDLTVEGDLDAGLLASVRTFACGLMDADESLRLLMDHLSARARPAVLVFFGDHLPVLGPDMAFLRRTGMIRESGEPALEELPVVYRVPCAIWTNFGSVELPRLVGMSHLMSVILDVMDHPDVPWLRFLRLLNRQYPVVHPGFRMDARGALRPGNEAPEGILADYRLLQYDLLLGARHALPALTSAPPEDR